MAHVSVKRFSACDTKEYTTEHKEARHAVRNQVSEPIARIERRQHRRVLRDAPQAHRGHRDEPQQHHRSERLADARSAQRLNRKQGEQDGGCGRQDIRLKYRSRHVEPFHRADRTEIAGVMAPSP